MADQFDLFEIHQALVAVALEAGQYIVTGSPGRHRTKQSQNQSQSQNLAVAIKANSADLVTETDQATERLVLTRLAELYPHVAFHGEETYSQQKEQSEQQGGAVGHGPTKLGYGPTFVCDPIDGTTNFVHGHNSYVSISLAFVVSKQPRVGVVYNPFRGELFHAVQTQGAFVTQIPVRQQPKFDGNPEAVAAAAKEVQLAERQSDDGNTVATTRLPLEGMGGEPLAGLDTAMVAVEWGSERSGNNWEVKVGTFAALAGDKTTTTRRNGESGAMAHSLRSLGSAALNLCGVAAGHLDAYWEGGCWAWDVAAGWVILAEAGGVMVGANRGEWDPALDCRRYLAVRAASGGRAQQDAFITAFWDKVAGTLAYDV